MEAEYVALSQAYKDLFLIMDIAQELCSALRLPQTNITNMYVRICEDNVGAHILAGLEPCRMTPRSKHYAIKYHWFWFCDQIAQCQICLIKIATKDKLGNRFTKGLVHSSFAHL